MPDLNELIPVPAPNAHVLEFLENRRSNLVKLMDGPGPNDAELERMLTIAARVPDHRKLAPWRFIVFEGDAQIKIGDHIGAIFKAKNPDAPIDRVEYASRLLRRAPVVIAVVSSPKDCQRGTPTWEQELSSAVVCYNLCLAAQAHGYGAQWLTEWIAYDSDVCTAMGVMDEEKVAGFVYVGTAVTASKERPRPDLKDLIERWA
jgi:nitroreductase